MNAKEEAPSAWTASGGPQLSRATTKRNTKLRRFLGDTLRVIAALSLALAVMAAGTWLTHQARPIVIVVGAYVFLASLVLLIAWGES